MTSRVWIYAVAGAAGLMLAGCASTMNEEACLAADWNAVGYQDGARGATTQGFDSRMKACGKHGITPDFNAYLAGWDEGVLRYCTPMNGFNAGSRGYNYQGVCPAQFEGEFLTAYSDGKQLYQLTSAVRNISSDIYRSQKRIEEIDRLISEMEVSLIRPDGDVPDRVQTMLDIKRLAEERGKLKRLVRELDYDLGQAEADLDDYRNEVGPEYGL